MGLKVLLPIIGTKRVDILREHDMNVVMMIMNRDTDLVEGKLLTDRKKPISALQTLSSLKNDQLSLLFTNFNL